jgi:hypothetical protein
MLIKAPISYSVTGRMPGRSRANAYGFFEYLDIELREIDEDEAPIAMSWFSDLEEKDIRLASGRYRNFRDADGMQHTRWFEGSHWLRIMDGYLSGSRVHFGVSTPLSADALKRNIDAGGIPGILPNVRGFTPRSKFITDDPMAMFDTVRENGRDAAISQTERGAHGLIIVDGIVYKRCNTPVLAVYETRLGSDFGSTICVDTHNRREKNRKVRNETAAGDCPDFLPLSMADELVETLAAESFIYDTHIAKERLARLCPVVHLDGTVPLAHDDYWRADYLVWSFYKAAEEPQHLDRFFETFTGEGRSAILRDLAAADIHGIWRGRGLPVELLEEASSLIEGRTISLDLGIGF